MNFIFSRDRTVASLSGHVINFPKGVPTHVPPSMHAEVIASGGVPEEELPEDDPKKPVIPTGQERIDLIRMAMEEVVAKNDRAEFTAGGAPHTKTLTAKLGFTVNNKERDDIWAQLKQE